MEIAAAKMTWMITRMLNVIQEFLLMWNSLELFVSSVHWHSTQDSVSNPVVSEQKVLVEDLALQINQPSLPELIR